MNQTEAGRETVLFHPALLVVPIENAVESELEMRHGCYSLSAIAFMRTSASSNGTSTWVSCMRNAAISGRMRTAASSAAFAPGVYAPSECGIRSGRVRAEFNQVFRFLVIGHGFTHLPGRCHMLRGGKLRPQAAHRVQYVDCGIVPGGCHSA